MHEKRPAKNPLNGDGSLPLIDGQLGDFRILREVGRGGMGIVYEAEQISLRRRVALKVLPFAATLDGRRLERFRTRRWPRLACTTRTSSPCTPSVANAASTTTRCR